MASIWRTAQLQHLRRIAPHADEVHFLQGDLGQASPKPTTFFTAGVAEMRAALRRHQVEPALRPGPLVPDEHDRLPTAKLKAFPAGLNAAIADAVASCLPQRRPCACGAPWAADLDRIGRLWQSAAAATESEMGPDYVRGGGKESILATMRADARSGRSPPLL